MKSRLTFGVIVLAISGCVATTKTAGSVGFYSLAASYTQITPQRGVFAASGAGELLSVPAEISLSFPIAVSNLPGQPPLALSTNGSIIATDADGDSFQFTFDGIWDFEFLGVLRFTGGMTSGSWTDSGPQDGLFNNSDGTQFVPLNFFGSSLTGWTELFAFGRPNPMDFSADFEGTSQGQVYMIPVPSTLAFLGISGLAAFRRRRA